MMKMMVGDDGDDFDDDDGVDGDVGDVIEKGWLGLFALLLTISLVRHRTMAHGSSSRALQRHKEPALQARSSRQRSTFQSCHVRKLAQCWSGQKVKQSRMSEGSQLRDTGSLTLRQTGQ